MKLTASACALALCVSAAVAGSPTSAGAKSGGQPVQPWMRSFPVDVKELAAEGENPYFILKPGYQLTLEGKEGGTPVRLIITVLRETISIAGIDTRVVEERETSGGQIAEVSRNYFAVHPGTRDVYYFGEDVDIYKSGKVQSHEGAWRHGRGNARFGLMMPGAPTVGQRHYQELAPKIAMDRAEVVSLSEKSTTPAGTFEQCLRVKETTPLEPLDRTYKVYAPGVGLIEDGPLKLVAYRYVQSAP
jgi:hypothetical protein